MSFIQWCCERGAKSHRKRTKKPWRKRQSRSWRYSFHKYFTTFFYLFLFFNYFTLSLIFYTFFTHDIYPHPHPRPTPTPTTHTHDPRPLPTTHDPRHLATLEIYTYRRKINETGVSYTYNLQKVWDKQLWLAEWKWLLTINLYSIYNSNDQRRFLNTMECDHRGKGQGKRTILRYFIFLHRSLS